MWGICIVLTSVFIIFVNTKKANMQHIKALLNFVGHYKYLIVIVVGVAMVGFVGDNCYMRRMQYDIQIADLKDEIDDYERQNNEAMRQLAEIDSGGRDVERIAREQYFMKAADEDIFVLSTDLKPEKTSTNEATQ